MENARKKKRVAELSEMGFDELDKSGEMEELKKLSEEAYEEKIHERFGKYPDSRKERLKNVSGEMVKVQEEQHRQQRISQLSAKSWNELDKSGEMEELKKLSEKAYEEKFHERFGVYPTI